MVAYDLKKFHHKKGECSRYEIYSDDGNLTRTFLLQLELAYLYRSEVIRLLELAGFKEINIYGDFNNRKFESDTDEIVVEATRIGSVY